MKNFLHADSNKPMAFRLISGSWAQKRLFLLLDMTYVDFMKNFLLADSSELLAVLDSFLPPVPKNVSSLLSRHDVRQVHEKFSSCRFEQANGF